MEPWETACKIELIGNQPSAVPEGGVKLRKGANQY